MGYKKIAKKKIDKQGLRCTFTGKYTMMLDPVHVIRRSHSPLLIDDPRNVIIGNRFYHDIFDNGCTKNHKGDSVTIRHLLEDYPFRVRAILHRMRSLDLYYFRRYCRRYHIKLDDNDNVICGRDNDASSG